MKNIVVSLLLVSVFSFSIISAQSVRTEVNKGVEEYKKGEFDKAEVDFKKALEKDVSSFEAHYDLANTYYKKGNYDEALKEYKSALALTKNKKNQSYIFYNVGNSLLKKKKIDDAIKAYINSLKLNPKDNEAKYNLSYALKQKQQNKKQNKQNKKNNKNNKNKKNKKKNF